MNEMLITTQHKAEVPTPPLWLNLVPGIEGRRVLQVTPRPDGYEIRVLSFRNQLATPTIGEPEHEIRGDPAQAYDFLRSAPPESADSAVLDGTELLESISSNRRLSQTFSAIWDLLSSDGRVVFCLPAGVSQLFYRFRILRSLRAQGFESARWYHCDPDAEDPLRIIPISENPSWAVRYLSPFPLGKTWRFGASFRQRVKRIALRTLGVFYPFSSILLVVDKTPSPMRGENPSLCEKVMAVVKGRSGHQKPLVATLSKQPYGGKEFLFIYNAAPSQLSAVAKLCRQNSPAARLLERECQNLALVRSQAELLATQGIRVPQVLYSEVSKAGVLLVTSAARGKTFSNLLREYSERQDWRGAQKIMWASVEFLAALHQELNGQLCDAVVGYGTQYLEDYLHLGLNSDRSRDRTLAQGPRVQHGDLTAEHLFLNESEQEWEVLDWEWLGDGYPPLFDFFSLLRSIGSSQDGRRFRTWAEKFRSSFIQVFFTKGRLSSLQREMLLSYCDRSQIDAGHAFGYLKWFLLWRCNRYRLDGAAWPGAQSVWEDLLWYAVIHERDFALK